MTELPVVVCIDVEPDERLPDPRGRATLDGFEATVAAVQRLRGALEEATRSPVAFTWTVRMDPQIDVLYGSPSWLWDRCAPALEAAVATGDSIGLHVHTFRWSHDDWVNDVADGNWVEQAVGVGVDAFRSSAGAAPTAFRFGDRFLSERLVAQLDELGVERDLTLEPGTRPLSPLHRLGTSRGALPDLRRVPLVPYHPAVGDFRRVAGDDGSRKLVLVPLTSARTQVETTSAMVRRAVRLTADAIRWRTRPTRPRRVAAPWEALPSPNSFVDLVSRAVLDPACEHLAFAFRTDVGRRRDVLDRVVRSLRWLVSAPTDRPVRFVGPSAVRPPKAPSAAASATTSE